MQTITNSVCSTLEKAIYGDLLLVTVEGSAMCCAGSVGGVDRFCGFFCGITDGNLRLSVTQKNASDFECDCTDEAKKGISTVLLCDLEECVILRRFNKNEDGISQMLGDIIEGCEDDIKKELDKFEKTT